MDFVCFFVSSNLLTRTIVLQCISTRVAHCVGVLHSIITMATYRGGNEQHAGLQDVFATYRGRGGEGELCYFMLL